ncbi:MAG: PBP1A family penicillin-binding protein [Brevinematales bacterium]|jgi:penicillin-binding protein 1A
MSFKRFLHEARIKMPLTTMQKIFFYCLIGLGAVAGIFIAYIIITFSELKDIKPLENYSTYDVPTKVYDINGKIITEFYREQRDIVSFKDLPDSLIKAIIAAEDNEFYYHHGFNPLAVLRAAIVNLIKGKRSQGGSTITQELAKNLFTGGEKSYFRKIIELWYAFQIEKKYSKEEILELYFNQVYLGHGCYGVQSASHFFFDKDVKDLTVGEASLLAGLVQAPETDSPILNPYKAQSRHRDVLNSMVKMNFLTKEEADDVFDQFWNNYSTIIKAKAITVQKSQSNPAPFFTEYIRQILTEKYGEDRLYSGGLQIFTTLDIDKQKVANDEMDRQISNEQINYNQQTRISTQYFKENYEDIIDMLSLYFGINTIKVGKSRVKDHLENMFKNYNDMVYISSFVLGLDGLNNKIKRRYLQPVLLRQKEDDVEGAMISINPKNGYIEALVGGSEFNYANQYNRAMLAKRQMGSLFKVVYYTDAIEKGLISPASTYMDMPMFYDDPSGKPYVPRNYEGTFMGKIRVRQALQYSVNVVSIQIWDKMLGTLGYNSIVDNISQYFGITPDDMRTRVKPSLSYALGVGAFTPFEVAKFFACVANDGMAIKPLAILKVKDRFGRIIDDFEMERDLDRDSRKQVMSTGAAFIMQDMLHTVLYDGTGAEAAKETEFNLNAGGKTGTAENWKDAWFAGFTKDLATVVWLGFDDPRKSFGRDRPAAAVAAPLWMRYMKQVLEHAPDPPFQQPPDVVQLSVCANSGLMTTPFCPHVISEYFLRDNAPVKKCDIHVSEATSREDEDKEIYKITNSLNLKGLELNSEESSNSNYNELDDIKQSMKQDKLNIKSGIE